MTKFKFIFNFPDLFFPSLGNNFRADGIIYFEVGNKSDERHTLQFAIKLAHMFFADAIKGLNVYPNKKRNSK